MQTANYALPYLMAAQAQKEVTHNEALNLLDLLAAPRLLSRGLAVPPAEPAAGEAWLVPAGGEGAWSGHAGEIALWYAGWHFVVPRPGLAAWILDENRQLLWSGADWLPLAPLTAAQVGALPSGGGALSGPLSVTGGGIVAGAAAPFVTRVGTVEQTPGGQVIGGGGEAALLIARFSANSGPPQLFFAKSRASTAGAHAAVQAGDVLGRLSFGGSDGGKVAEGARIQAVAESAPGADYVATRLSFQLSAGFGPAERLALTGAGALELGGATVIDQSRVPRLRAYTLATLPSAAAHPQGLVHVADEAGGAQPAFSDGAAWRRFSDRAVVS